MGTTAVLNVDQPVALIFDDFVTFTPDMSTVMSPELAVINHIKLRQDDGTPTPTWLRGAWSSHTSQLPADFQVTIDAVFALGDRDTVCYHCVPEPGSTRRPGLRGVHILLEYNVKSRTAIGYRIWPFEIGRQIAKVDSPS